MKRTRSWRCLSTVGLSVLVVVGIGTASGLGLFTFGYGGGLAYLSNNPAACANCHIMQSHFDSWQNSSHRHVAVCNDCHLSHDVIGKWITKADNGFFHSLAFTTGQFHEPIQIKPRNRRITQQACLDCHEDFVHHTPWAEAPGAEPLNCVHCHRAAGHGLK